MKFRILGVFAWIHVVLGVIAICAAVAVFLALTFGLWSPTANDATWFMATKYGVAVIGAVFVAGLSIGAYGQFILLVMKIEENTQHSRPVFVTCTTEGRDTQPVFLTCPRTSGDSIREELGADVDTESENGSGVNPEMSLAEAQKTIAPLALHDIQVRNAILVHGWILSDDQGHPTVTKLHGYENVAKDVQDQLAEAVAKFQSKNPTGDATQDPDVKSIMDVISGTAPHSLPASPCAKEQNAV